MVQLVLCFLWSCLSNGEIMAEPVIKTPETLALDVQIRALQHEAFYGPAIETRALNADVNEDIAQLRSSKFPIDITNIEFGSLPKSERVELLRQANESLSPNAIEFWKFLNLQPSNILQFTATLLGPTFHRDQQRALVPQGSWNFSLEEINKNKELVRIYNVVSLEHTLFLLVVGGQSSEVRPTLEREIRAGISKQTYDQALTALRIHLEQFKQDWENYKRRQEEKRERLIDRMNLIRYVTLGIRLIVSFGLDLGMAFYDYFTIPDPNLLSGAEPLVAADIQALEAAGVPGFGQVEPVSNTLYEASLTGSGVTQEVVHLVQGIEQVGLLYGVSYVRQQLTSLIFGKTGEPESQKQIIGQRRTEIPVSGGSIGSGTTVLQVMPISAQQKQIMVIIAILMFIVFVVILFVRR